MTKIKRHEILYYYDVIKSLISSNIISRKFMVKDIKSHDAFQSIRPTKIGFILTKMCEDYNLIIRSERIKSDDCHYVQSYEVK